MVLLLNQVLNDPFVNMVRVNQMLLKADPFRLKFTTNLTPLYNEFMNTLVSMNTIGKLEDISWLLDS